MGNPEKEHNVDNLQHSLHTKKAQKLGRLTSKGAATRWLLALIMARPLTPQHPHAMDMLKDYTTEMPPVLKF